MNAVVRFEKHVLAEVPTTEHPPHVYIAKSLETKTKAAMQLRLSIGLTFMLLTAGSCAATDVRTHFDPTADFSGFRTYAFAGFTDKGQDGVVDIVLMRKQIENMISQQMDNKGLRQVALEEYPDVLVQCRASVKEKEREENTRSSMVGPYAGPAVGRRYEDVTTYKYKEGTLSISLIRPPQNHSVWQANIVTILSNSKEENTRMANEGIMKAFEDYPPKTKFR